VDVEQLIEAWDCADMSDPNQPLSEQIEQLVRGGQDIQT
jgi:hypothetical protein